MKNIRSFPIVMKKNSMRPLTKNTGGFILVLLSLVVLSSKILAAQTITITPSGGSDDYAIIQNAVNGPGFGGTIILNGNFIIRNTIVLKANIIWVLNGSIQLGNAVNKTMITDPIAGATNIHMSGGVYDGNLANQSTEGSCINFQKVTYSHFSDFTTQNYGKGFTFELGCNNNICDRLIGKYQQLGMDLVIGEIIIHGMIVLPIVIGPITSLSNVRMANSIGV